MRSSGVKWHDQPPKNLTQASNGHREALENYSLGSPRTCRWNRTEECQAENVRQPIEQRQAALASKMHELSIKLAEIMQNVEKVAEEYLALGEEVKVLSLDIRRIGNKQTSIHATIGDRGVYRDGRPE